MPVVQVHVPKTGGSALRHAIKPTGAYRWGHSSTLPAAVSDDRYLVTLRDPLARFLSAYIWSRNRLIPWGYPTAEALALSLPEPRIDDLVVLKPQVHWVTSAERLRQPDVAWVGFTETLDEDFIRLCDLMGWRGLSLPQNGHKRRNTQRYHEPLTDEARDRVLEHYAADVELVEEMRHG